jgi:hypothetical protein
MRSYAALGATCGDPLPRYAAYSGVLPRVAPRNCSRGPVVAVTASPDYDTPLSAIREHVEDLGTWLGFWSNRKEPDAQARRCASDAVDALDSMLRQLYLVRGWLTCEIRASDDASAARADELLERLRGDQR